MKIEDKEGLSEEETMKTLTKTEAMLDTLIAMGHLVGIDTIKIAAKKIPHRHKMVLLRFWNDWQQTGDKYYEDKFLDYWRPIRKYLIKELAVRWAKKN